MCLLRPEKLLIKSSMPLEAFCFLTFSFQSFSQNIVLEILFRTEKFRTTCNKVFCNKTVFKEVLIFTVIKGHNKPLEAAVMWGIGLVTLFHSTVIKSKINEKQSSSLPIETHLLEKYFLQAKNNHVNQL